MATGRRRRTQHRPAAWINTRTSCAFTNAADGEERQRQNHARRKRQSQSRQIGSVAIRMNKSHGRNRTDHGDIHGATDDPRTTRFGRIIIDSADEISRLTAVAQRRVVRPRVLIRVTPGIEAHTHDYIATAHDDQKFGFSLATGAAAAAVEAVLAENVLELRGLHCHIGSQIFDTSAYKLAAERLLRLQARVCASGGRWLPELNLGGGFGIHYTQDDDPTPLSDLALDLRKIITQECAALRRPVPTLVVEPGRAIIGPAMLTLYRVGTVKTLPGLRSYVSVDGGMSDNIRTALYGATYTAALAGRASIAPPTLTRIVGKHCESGDIVVRDAYLPDDIHPGDLLAVAATGAYCRSMASNYNHTLRPPVIAVTNARARVIVRRETEADLLALDVALDKPDGRLEGKR
jgi:diaminopimelate decarboxylase